MQRQTSIEDQIRECRDAAARNGWSVLDEYIQFDEGTSGKSRLGRDGLEQLVALAKMSPRPFDGILIDDTSRFGRNLSDTLPLSDLISFKEVFLHFANSGLDSRDRNFRTIFIQNGQQDENYSRGMAEKVHRGQRGRVLDGCNPAGQTFGYASFPVENPNRKGPYGRPYVEKVELHPDPAQKAVVIRIFEQYAAGLGYRGVAAQLNKDGVPSPLKGSGKRVRLWCSRTIQKILTNDKYRGVHIWNRTKAVQNPESGRKEQRPRPESEWERVLVPDWRLVSDELWAACESERLRRNKNHTGQKIGGSNRTGASREYIFSGILFCAICGSRFVITGGTGEGVRYGCYSHRFRGASTCSNHWSVLRRNLQDQLVSALAENLADPRFNELLSSEFHQQLQRAWDDEARRLGEVAGRAPELKEEFAALDKQIENVVNAIAEYGGAPSLYARLTSLEGQKGTVQELLALQRETAEPLPAIEAIREFLERKTMDLAGVITGDPVRAKQEIQKRVEKLMLRPVETPDGLTYEVTGDIRLFSAEVGVLLGTSHLRSVKQYKSLILPFAATIFQKPNGSQPLPQAA